MKLKNLIKIICIRLFNLIFNYGVKGKNNRKAVRDVSPFVRYSISKDAKIQCGYYPFFHRRALSISVSKNGILNIGSGTFFNDNVIINCHEKINIGENCLFGPNVYVFDHDHAIVNGIVEKNIFITKPIYIGNNVWIGAGCIILKGAVIEDGAVIGAGCVVSGYVGKGKRLIQKRVNSITRIKE